jgi:hypothetical protein
MSMYNYEIGELFDGTAQVSIAADTSVTGDGGCAFTTEFAVGYMVIVGDETRVVASITDDNNMVVTNAFAEIEGPVNYEGVNLINLEELATKMHAPKSAFTEYSQRLALGSGGVRGAGWATGQWRWGFLSQAQRDQLRTFCTGMSNEVYIRTRKNDTSDAYEYYSGVVMWPVGEEEKHAGRRLDFVFAFQSLVEVSIG